MQGLPPNETELMAFIAPALGLIGEKLGVAPLACTQLPLLPCHIHKNRAKHNLLAVIVDRRGRSGR